MDNVKWLFRGREDSPARVLWSGRRLGCANGGHNAVVRLSDNRHLVMLLLVVLLVLNVLHVRVLLNLE